MAKKVEETFYVGCVELDTRTGCRCGKKTVPGMSKCPKHVGGYIPKRILGNSKHDSDD